MHQQREEVNGRELNFVFKKQRRKPPLSPKKLIKNLRSSNRLVQRWARADKRYILSLWRQFFYSFHVRKRDESRRIWEEEN